MSDDRSILTEDATALTAPHWFRLGEAARYEGRGLPNYAASARLAAC